jgi:metallo-beta-lactamase class B
LAYCRRFTWVAAGLLSACVTAFEPAATRGEVEFEALAPDVWMHTSYETFASGARVLSHGLVIVRGDHSVLVDSGWNDAQTADILDWAELELRKPVQTAIFTHAHADKMGGVDTVRARGIATYASALTNALAPEEGVRPAEYALDLPDAGDRVTLEGLDIFYPGAGHSRDNITVYHPDSRILFGGCLIRPGETESLGNTADADLSHWADAARLLKSEYPDSSQVVPSHGAPGSIDLLSHTEKLADPANP